jgi:hypothetical protein
LSRSTSFKPPALPVVVDMPAQFRFVSASLRLCVKIPFALMRRYGLGADILTLCSPLPKNPGFCWAGVLCLVVFTYEQNGIVWSLLWHSIMPPVFRIKAKLVRRTARPTVQRENALKFRLFVGNSSYGYCESR